MDQNQSQRKSTADQTLARRLLRSLRNYGINEFEIPLVIKRRPLRGVAHARKASLLNNGLGIQSNFLEYHLFGRARPDEAVFDFELATAQGGEAKDICTNIWTPQQAERSFGSAERSHLAQNATDVTHCGFNFPLAGVGPNDEG
jgi:hypothetical protein